MDLEELRTFAEQRIPFNRFLGLRVVALETGHAELEIPFREELIGDPQRPAMHGGVISMLADTAGGIAVWSALQAEGARVSTIDLRIDYVRPGRLLALRADARVVRVGGRVGVVDIHLSHADDHVTVATGKGVYAIHTPRDA